MNLKLDAHLVAAVAQFKATTDIRYYLNGVYVEPIPSGGALIIATNGHALCMWKDTDGMVERPVILCTSKKLLAACSSKDAKHLQLNEDRLTVTDKKGLEFFVQPKREKWEIEAKYPDWKRVVPKTESALTLFDALNPTYVSMVAQALKIGTSDRYASGISFNQPAQNGSIVVTSSKTENFLAVIMPLRESVSHQPTWVQALKATPDDAPLPSQQPSDAAPAAGEAA
jgi:DNA polymerase III sliding clamp (beta) subunit (PCNA family)